MAKIGPGNEADLAAAGGAILFDDLRADDVGRHQVRRELDAVELEMHRLRERLDQQRLRQPGHAAQQAVAAGEERDQDLLDDRLLADDRAAQLVPQPRREALRLVEGQHRPKLYRR